MQQSLVSVREASREDLDGICRLAEDVHGWKPDRQLLLHKFWENPDGEPVIMLAEYQSRIVGQYALWPTQLRFGDEVVQGAQSLDTMTHPDFRGKGVFVQLANAAFDVAHLRGVVVLYGFPNHQSYPGFVKRLNWDHTGDVKIFARPLRGSAHPRIPAALGPIADLIVAAWPLARKDKHAQIRFSPPAWDALGALLTATEAGASDACAVHNSLARWKWRFSSPSQINYRWVSVYREARLEAVAVWGSEEKGYRALLAALVGADEAALSSAVQGALAQATASGKAVMQATCSSPARTKVLRRNGFVHRGSTPLIVRKTTTRTLGANPHNHEAWNIFGADLDTY